MVLTGAGGGQVVSITVQAAQLHDWVESVHGDLELASRASLSLATTAAATAAAAAAAKSKG
jgi:hypothetical protein